MTHEVCSLATVLEKARLLSIENQSELVVCTNFLPWMDLALSADVEAPERPGPGRCAVERRWLEVVGLILAVNEAGVSSGRNWTALASFGLLRGWHAEARQRSIRAHGPDCLTVEASPWFKPPWFA